MAQAQKGSKVQVNYTCILDDGKAGDAPDSFVEGSDDDNESSSLLPGGPMEFTIGEGRMLPQFEKAVIGLEPGQSVRVKIQKAYGVRDEEKVGEVKLDTIKGGIPPTLGQQLEVRLEDGSPLLALVTEVTDTTFTLDANHPLAGLDLIFDIKLKEIL